MTITQLYVTPRSVGGGPTGDSNAGPGRQPAAEERSSDSKAVSVARRQR